MGVQDMLEIFFFKECLRAWVKSCDKFVNMNDDYIDRQTFFVFKSSSYLCSFMVGPRTFWTPLVQCAHVRILHKNPRACHMWPADAPCLTCDLPGPTRLPAASLLQHQPGLPREAVVGLDLWRSSDRCHLHGLFLSLHQYQSLSPSSQTPLFL